MARIPKHDYIFHQPANQLHRIRHRARSSASSLQGEVANGQTPNGPAPLCIEWMSDALLAAGCQIHSEYACGEQKGGKNRLIYVPVVPEGRFSLISFTTLVYASLHTQNQARKTFQIDKMGEKTQLEPVKLVSWEGKSQQPAKSPYEEELHPKPPLLQRPKAAWPPATNGPPATTPKTGSV